MGQDFSEIKESANNFVLSFSAGLSYLNGINRGKNIQFKEFEKAGMIASGKNSESGLVEIVELPKHPFFIGVQYHPELKSTVENPHPLFVHFVKAAKEFADQKNTVRNPLLQGEMI